MYLKRFKAYCKPERGDVVIEINDDFQFLPFHEFDCRDFFNWCIKHCTLSNAPIGVSAKRYDTLWKIKPRFFEYFGILDNKCIRVSETSMRHPYVWIIHKSDWESSRGLQFAGWFDISHYLYVPRHVNSIDIKSTYPKPDSFILAGGRNNGKTELIKQLSESAKLRVEPFPDYKYDSAAYQNIVASDVVLKEHKEYLRDALVEDAKGYIHFERDAFEDSDTITATLAVCNINEENR